MAMELIETIEVGAGGAASIEFTSIPQDGVDLLLLVSDRTSATGGFLTINGSAISAFSAVYLQGNGSGSSSSTATNALVIGGFTSYTANTFGSGQVYVSNYTSTTNKSISIEGVSENNATSSLQRITAASYSTSSAVTSIGLTNATFSQYSTASLYKIY